MMCVGVSPGVRRRSSVARGAGMLPDAPAGAKSATVPWSTPVVSAHDPPPPPPAPPEPSEEQVSQLTSSLQAASVTTADARSIETRARDDQDMEGIFDAQRGDVTDNTDRRGECLPLAAR